MSKKEKKEFWAVLAGTFALAGLITWFNYRPNLGFFTHAATFFFIVAAAYLLAATTIIIHRLGGFGDVHRRALRQQDLTFQAGSQQGGGANSVGEDVNQRLSRRHGANVEMKKAFLPYLIICLISVALAVVFTILS